MTEPEPQLTIDGGEVVLPATPRAHTPFTSAQRAILRLIQEREKITSSDAGVIVHLHRAPPCIRCVAVGRCGYIASDGRDALKRLEARGCVRRSGTGVWVLP